MTIEEIITKARIHGLNKDISTGLVELGNGESAQLSEDELELLLPIADREHLWFTPEPEDCNDVEYYRGRADRSDDDL